MIGSSIGVLLAGGLAMPLVEIGGGGEAGFRFMGLIFGALMITAFCLICFFWTRKTKTLPVNDKKSPFREQVKIAFRNTPFKMLMMMYTFQSLGIGVLMAGLIYYAKYGHGLTGNFHGYCFSYFNCNGYYIYSSVA